MAQNIQVTINTESVIGSGYFGTVYRSTLGTRTVAVKKIHRDQNYDDNELVPLKRGLINENIACYLFSFVDSEFLYLVMELCAGNLDQIINGDYSGPSPGTPAEMMRQVTRGIQYLHSLDILHRNLKPTNILISIPYGDGELPKMKLADFGLCKALDEALDTSNASNNHHIETAGWQAVECYLHNKEGQKYGKSSDIFTLGCVYGYTFTKGHHPFGNVHAIDPTLIINIVYGTPDPANVRMIANDFLRELVKRMISSNADNRPQLDEILAILRLV